MKDYQYFAIARALHVVGVVLWIGGVAFVTTVLIPSIKQIAVPAEQLKLFEQLERRFALQARIVTVVTGLSGLYMLALVDGWTRYQQLQFWWLHLMTLIWVVFTVVLFVLEPLVLHRWFHRQAIANASRAFAWLHRLHVALLTLSLIAVVGAVAGSHGVQFF